MSTEIAVRPAATLTPLEFTEEQRKMIRDMYAPGSSDLEFQVLMEVARARRLNPLLRQIFFVKRWDSQRRAEVWAPQVSIDGFRLIADRTGQYDGQDEPEYAEEKDGKPTSCKVRVYRKGVPRPFVGVAYWSEFAQVKRDGSLMPMWQQLPRHMLAKVAEALALRKAFPEDLSGLYTDDELPADGARTQRLEAPPPPASADASVVAAMSLVLTNQIRDAKTEQDLLALVPKLKALPEAEKKPLREAFDQAFKALKAKPVNEPAEEAPADAVPAQEG